MDRNHEGIGVDEDFEQIRRLVDFLTNQRQTSQLHGRHTVVLPVPVECVLEADAHRAKEIFRVIKAQNVFRRFGVDRGVCWAAKGGQHYQPGGEEAMENWIWAEFGHTPV